MAARTEQDKSFAKLIQIGIALSAERNHDRLMESILIEAKDMCNADGGTLYLRTEDDTLKFEIMRTDSLDIALGGTTGKEIIFPPIPMYNEKTGNPNHRNVTTYVALTGESVNIPDAYKTEDFDFSGTRKFDQGTGFRSKSFLTVPMKNHEGDVIGVLQLLNAQDAESGEVIPFGGDIQPLIEALTSQAAVALDNQLLLDAQKELLDSFIELIASAIDSKSPYTGGHCQRVPELTNMLARAVCASTDEPFKDFDLTEEEWYELHIAGWLHDCGKVTTPEYVVDKATKLETIYNRIHEIRTRFEVIKRDAIIDNLKAVAAGGNKKKLDKELKARLAQIDDDYDFIATCNIGGEFMDPALIDRVEQIASIQWQRTIDDRLGISQDEMKRKERSAKAKLPVSEPLLNDRLDHIIPYDAPEKVGYDEKFGFRLEFSEHKYNQGEVYNLSIARGTLTAEERFKINDHIMQTITMLEQLPFPKHLARVPEYAGGHHEKMDGTGYPRGIKKDDMSIPARIMAIADIFEALTAADRPYKPPKTLSASLRIMSFMKKDQHIDGVLFELFLRSGIYMEYAKKYLMPEQIDEVDIEDYLGGD
jgi:HD-GYP domain-containing protein (c-di-GMP phosphodiesterase class II)